MDFGNRFIMLHLLMHGDGVILKKNSMLYISQDSFLQFHSFLKPVNSFLENFFLAKCVGVLCEHPQIWFTNQVNQMPYLCSLFSIRTFLHFWSQSKLSLLFYMSENVFNYMWINRILIEIWKFIICNFNWIWIACLDVVKLTK